MWLMLDEAHVTTIAIHPGYRNRGLGELQLSTLIAMAYDINAQRVTLEVVSPTVSLRTSIASTDSWWWGRDAATTVITMKMLIS